MKSVSSRIWTRVVVSISYDDNHYTAGNSMNNLPHDEFAGYENSEESKFNGN